MTQAFYILLGFLPSIAWLIFYLKKDEDPEPRKKIVEFFLLGGLAALIAAGLETFLLRSINPLRIKGAPKLLLIFLGVALIEETLKFLPVQIRGIRDLNMDEPVDIMVYMISTAMGFATAENIALFFSRSLRFIEVFAYSGLRFLGATLLHALSSGVLGYFLALSFYHEKKSLAYKTIGFLAAITLHTFYNFSIIKMQRFAHVTLPALLLSFMFFLLLYLFQRAKELESICKS